MITCKHIGIHCVLIAEEITCVVFYVTDDNMSEAPPPYTAFDQKPGAPPGT